ncbi:MAG: AAA family ATPase [Caldilineaceae bacterium]|nr:AAA family ATPase [Caldilineaceae bacterium]
MQAPRAWLDGVPLTGFVSRKAEALLYYLACTGRAHSRESLAALLWGESTDSAARANLRKVLSILHQLLPAHLHIERQTVGFRVDSPHSVDAARFATDVTVLTTAASLTQPQVTSLQTALSLYRDDFLAGFYVKGAPEFERWLLAERGRLRELAVQGLQRLSQHFAEAEAWPNAIAALRQLLALEPWREEAHRGLMSCLASNGERGAALAHFDICRQMLADELDVPPSEETVALARQIRAGTLGPVSAAEPSPKLSQGAPLPRHNLPAQASPFVGRKTELETLAQWLADPRCRILTILGAGGMGKTRLALALAQQLLPRYRDGVFFVALAPVEGSDGIMPAIAQAVGFPFQNEQRSAQAQLTDFLRGKQLLLVLDNWEHLLAASPRLGELAQNCPGVQIVVTSRERLRVSLETLFVLPGLSYPTGEISQAAGYSAVELFVDTMDRQQRDAPKTRAEWQAVARICHLVDGMPLAIVLAAGWLGLLRLDEIAGEIAHSADILESDLRDAPPRQRSMRIVFEQTWQRLTQAERALYMRLSVFHDGFTGNGAMRVAGATISVLRGLTDKALLWRDSRDRYHIHELLRQYAAEKLAAHQLERKTCQSHSTYYIDLLSRSEPELYGSNQLFTLEMLRAEEANLRAAWQWALTHQPFEELAQAVNGWGLFYEISGRLVEGETLLRTTIESLDDASKENRAYARLLIWCGVFGKVLSGNSYASAHYRLSLALAERLEASGQAMGYEKALALLELGNIAWYMDSESADRYLAQSLALSQGLENPWLRARAVQEKARVVQISGHYREAHRLASESLAIWQALGDQASHYNTLVVLGWSAMKLDQTDEAFGFVRQQRALAERTGNRTLLAGSYFNEGAVLEQCGRFAAAADAYAHSMEIAKSSGLRHNMGSTGEKLAHMRVQLGQYEDALALAQTILEGAKAMGMTSHRAHALAVRGLAYLGRGEYSLAGPPLAESEQIFRQIVQHAIYHIKCDGFLGYMARYEGDYPRAWAHLSRALRWGIEREDVQTLSMNLPLAALLLADRGEVARAVALYALACQHPRIADSRWYADVVGREMDGLPGALSPQTTAEATGASAWQILREAALALLE